MKNEIINNSKIVDEIYPPQKLDDLEKDLNWFYTDAEKNLKNRVWRMCSPAISVDKMTPKQLLWYHMCLNNGRIIFIHFRDEWIKIFEDKLKQL